eukprot:TRINITY_DN4182_c0_g1_i1.p2 TRINITY_DN4182_c0_g1~~TRINITY_DN4182_c0_g1_i1.p2  ORF type:complete len:116 (+),score=0.85 TRINITY_DN4182_c0_g1_i1:133-480(+)
MCIRDSFLTCAAMLIQPPHAPCWMSIFLRLHLHAGQERTCTDVVCWVLFGCCTDASVPAIVCWWSVGLMFNLLSLVWPSCSGNLKERGEHGLQRQRAEANERGERPQAIAFSGKE